MHDEPNLTWRQENRDLAQNWPKDAAGTPEKAVFLTGTVEADSQSDILISLLRSYDIPVMKQYDKDGTLGKVVLGFSGYGVSLYVPESMLEDAKNLMKPVDEEDPQ